MKTTEKFLIIANDLTYTDKKALSVLSHTKTNITWHAVYILPPISAHYYRIPSFHAQRKQCEIMGNKKLMEIEQLMNTDNPAQLTLTSGLARTLYFANTYKIHTILTSQPHRFKFLQWLRVIKNITIVKPHDLIQHKQEGFYYQPNPLTIHRKPHELTN